MTSLRESSAVFKINLGGEHSIDANLFIELISHTVDLITETATSIDPECFIRLEVKANNEGSFEIVFNAVVRYTESLFTAENITLASTVVSGAAAFLQIKQFLKGKKAKGVSSSASNDNLIIENQQNERIEKDSKVVKIFFKNKKIDDSISSIISCAKQGKRDSLNFVPECAEYEVKITNEEYDAMIQNVVDPDEPLLPESKTTVQLWENADLIVKKPDLIGDSKWELILNKHIEAKISDLEFKKKVKDGTIKLFGGCKLTCSLEVSTKVDENYEIISVDYHILKVHAIKDKNDQIELLEHISCADTGKGSPPQTDK
jgi:hypothetical protein